MPIYASNKTPQEVKRRYFERIRQGLSGSESAREVGVSLSCGSKWFIEAGSVSVNEEVPISSRYLSKTTELRSPTGLTAGEPVKSIALRIGKSFRVFLSGDWTPPQTRRNPPAVACPTIRHI